MVKTDNIATSYFQSQKKITSKQARWQDFLAEFDYVLEYKPGRGNVVADALSRKYELASITTAHCDIQDAIKYGMQHDPKAKKQMELAAQGKTWRFWIENGFLLTTGRRVYVPKFGSIRRDIFKESHDILCDALPGQQRTRKLINDIYFFPHMQDNIECYV